MPVSIGIDLGTTYSCVVHYDENGNETVIPNSDDDTITPSVVHFDLDGGVTIGKEAKERLTDDPDNTVVGIKRRMGTEFPLEFAGQMLSPESISALILQRLAIDASEYLGVPVNDLAAVVTVPAYFGVVEKEATAAAARLANLNCLELVPEPVAAAYAYGLGKDPTKTSLVYDLGGGTFDVAVVGMYQNQHRVWAIDGEHRLGGLDWDERIQDKIWGKIDELDNAEAMRYDDDVCAAVEEESELLKRRLTTRPEVTQRIHVGREWINVKLTRAEFEEATRDLMNMTLEASRRVLAAAQRAGAPPVSQVLLVGGSTRMPMVRETIERELGLPVLLSDPDRAVARGAGMLAQKALENVGNSSQRNAAGMQMQLRERAEQTADRAIVTVLPRAIGILLHSSHSDPPGAQYIAPLFAANTPLPAKLVYSASTIANEQRRAHIQLYEQAGAEFSERVEDNRILLEGEISNIPPMPAGTRIIIDLEVNTNGLIEISARVLGSAEETTINGYIPGVLDEEEIFAQQQALTGMRLL